MVMMMMCHIVTSTMDGQTPCAAKDRQQTKIIAVFLCLKAIFAVFVIIPKKIRIFGFLAVTFGFVR